MLISSKVIANSGVEFGTSGARGLVSQFTPDVCAAFTHSFVKVMQQSFTFDWVAIAIDNRPSSADMARSCAKALQQLGVPAVYYGVVPTPALAFTNMLERIPAIMVTGSHIPFDRNGLKFYRPDGEISKADEQAILQESVEFAGIAELPQLSVNTSAAEAYLQRYTSLFDQPWLAGKRIGIYEHSSAGRDLYTRLFTLLGAEVISLERSDQFVPVDTEAVSDEDKAKAIRWSEEHNLDAIFSTDGDGDRPLVADEQGEWLRGDILGLLCSKELHIEALAVPVSCNTAIESCNYFTHVSRTRIGSPYVIAEFSNLVDKYKAIAGFEANGGFLLGSDVEVNGHPLKALPTRDAVLPALMLLLAASGGNSIADLVRALPPRFTHSDRIKDFATERSRGIISRAKANPGELLKQLGFGDAVLVATDDTDGLRMTLQDHRIIHLRPSGNAPELRCYAEADSVDAARYCVDTALQNVQSIQ